MGEIRSALDIALEKTKEIVADKSSLEADEFKKKGKKIISLFLDDPQATLDSCFKDIDKSKIALVKDGMFSALSSNLVLAQDQIAIKRLKRLEIGFLKLIEGSKKTKLIFEQLEGFFSEYIEGRKQIREQLGIQYGPRLKKKTEALAKQLGTNVHVDPESDPEFLQILRQNYAQFDERYNTIIAQVKDELKTMFEQANK